MLFTDPLHLFPDKQDSIDGMKMVFKGKNLSNIAQIKDVNSSQN